MAPKFSLLSLFNRQSPQSGAPQSSAAPNTPGGVQKRVFQKGGKIVDADTDFAPIEEEADDDSDGGGHFQFQKHFGPGGFSGRHDANANRAHIAHRNLLAQSLNSPGSLDPNTLGDPPNSDARRWLKNHGMVLLLPENWRYMGQQSEGKAISFHSTGTKDGHGVDVNVWRLPADVSFEHLLAGYLEEAGQEQELGRLESFQPQRFGDTEGVVLVGWGPSTPEELAHMDGEKLYLATDGTGLRKMSWRGAVKRHGESELVIVSFASPIETFPDAKAVYDAILAKGSITSD